MASARVGKRRRRRRRRGRKNHPLFAGAPRRRDNPAEEWMVVIERRSYIAFISAHHIRASRRRAALVLHVLTGAIRRAAVDDTFSPGRTDFDSNFPRRQITAADYSRLHGCSVAARARSSFDYNFRRSFRPCLATFLSGEWILAQSNPPTAHRANKWRRERACTRSSIRGAAPRIHRLIDSSA